MELISGILASTIRLSVPLLIAGLGAVFAARAGIVNVGLEGFMLMGALMGPVGSYITGSAWGGAVFAVMCGIIMASIFSVFTVNLHANQTVIGTSFNIIASGMSATLNRIIFGVTASAPAIAVYERFPIPGLCNIPVLGEVLFNQPLPCYLAFLFVPISWYIMQRTHTGLSIRAVGENPQACDTLGISVYGLRWKTMLFAGAMAGLAGSYMSMGNLSYFIEDMVAGQGFMVLAIIILGSYSPTGVLAAALLFGASQAVQYRIQGSGVDVPRQFLTMIPYVITLFAVCGFMKVSRQPAAGGKPYIKE